MADEKRTDICPEISEGHPVWGPSTKRAVAFSALVLAALLLYRFRQVLPPLLIAFLLAFILHPVVRFLMRHTRMGRTAATAVVFIVLILVGLGLMAAPVTAVLSIQRAFQSLQLDLGRLAEDVGAFVSKPVNIMGYSVDLSPLYQELNKTLTSYLGRVAQGTISVLMTVASGAVWVIFILISTFYLVRDADRIIAAIDNLTPPAYREDVVCLRREIARVWNAFLRGQLLLGLVIGVLVAIACTILGLPYPAVLGLVAGVLEFLPSIGPTIAAIPAILLALFQGSSYLPLTNFWVAVLTALTYIIIQQVENNLLVPRILGGSLELHPLVVLIAIIIGGNVAGILGMLVASPMVATLRILARYVLYRVYDRDPFAEIEARRSRLQRPSMWQRAVRLVAAFFRRPTRATPVLLRRLGRHAGLWRRPPRAVHTSGEEIFPKETDDGER